MKFDIWVFFNLSWKFTFDENLTRIIGTFSEDVCTFMRIFGLILLRMWYVSDKSCRGNQNNHIMPNYFFFQKLCNLWGNVEINGSHTDHS